MDFTQTTYKFSFLRQSLGLVAIAVISTGAVVACSPTPSPEVSASNPAIAVTNNPQTTSSSKPTSPMTNNMGRMRMDLGAADANFDLRFIDAMTPHHQGALNMAKEAKEKSQRPEIQKLADDIIKAQTKEIAELQTWRKQWYPSASSMPMAHNAQMGHMMEMNPDQMKGMMMSRDLGAKDAEFDLRFIEAMIPHHEGAVVMAQEAATKSTHPEIKQLAKDIISSQQAEIKEMQGWLQTWYKK